MTAPPGVPEPDAASPCIGICIVGGEGYCIGCFRTRDELAEWWTATPARKRAILDCCRQRQRDEATR